MRLARFLLILLLAAGPACTGVQPSAAPPERQAPAAVRDVDRATLLRDIGVLAADSMEGRLTGTAGNARARAFLLERFAEVGLVPFGDDYGQPFSFVGGDGVRREGVNVVGMIRGTEHSEAYIVVTAHYDHLGVRNGEIYNGADDNASGTAALLAVAEHFRQNPPRHSLIVVATDAEEGSVLGGVGLQGARAFVANPPVPLERVLVNVNMDMVSRSDGNELYVAGTFHTPALLPYIERAAGRAPVTLLPGHDRPDLPARDDWTMLSDHGAFHEAGLPFLYFGVEDHPDYHRPTDTVENIHPDFYVEAVQTVIETLGELDAGLGGRRP